MVPLRSPPGSRTLPGHVPAAGSSACAAAASTAGLLMGMGSAGAGVAPAAAGPAPPPLPPADTGTAAREDTAVFTFGANCDEDGGRPVVS